MTAVHGRFTRSQTLIQNGESFKKYRWAEMWAPKAISMHEVKSIRGVNVLVLAGGEIDCVDKDGNTPLHIAARYGHELLINTLITSGADCTRWACFYNRRLVHRLYWITLLKSFTLSLFRRGIHGMFPLHLAALNAHADCCRKLLSSGTSAFGHLTQRRRVIVPVVCFFTKNFKCTIYHF